MPFDTDELPMLSDAATPPIVNGTAELTTAAFAGANLNALLSALSACRTSPADTAPHSDPAWLFDAAIAYQLGFRRSEGLDLQARALTLSPLVRIARQRGDPGHSPVHSLRVLALCAPGDLMVNTPLDFITNELDIRLDLLFIRPGEKLPPRVPDHDVAFFAISEADPPLLRRLRHLWMLWPRPVLNDPAFIPMMARDTLSRALAGVPGLCSPTAVAVCRTDLERHLRGHRPAAGFGVPYPCLIRPVHSHAGAGLSRITCDAELYAYLRLSFEDRFFLTEFHDYKDRAGLYRKLRVAFIDRRPYLCHMAASRHWMVHYLNAGMTESAGKRALEAEAMATFDDDFARRHEAAFAALHERLGFDYYSIDCSETPDGKLLLFEADTAAIIHMMDPPELFPYKQPQMRRIFQAVGAMLQRRADQSALVTPAGHRTGFAVPA